MSADSCRSFNTLRADVTGDCELDMDSGKRPLHLYKNCGPLPTDISLQPLNLCILKLSSFFLNVDWEQYSQSYHIKTNRTKINCQSKS